MNKQEKSLRIAELEGWRLCNKIDLPADTYWRFEELKVTSRLMSLYSTFNGLMEIVERMNIEHKDIENNGFLIDKTCIVVHTGKDNDNNCPEFAVYDYVEKGTLIDALQDAIIFYKEQVKK